jgi:hypothetical protein
MIDKRNHYINGAWVASQGGSRFSGFQSGN